MSARFAVRGLALSGCVLAGLIGLSAALGLLEPIVLYAGWENQQAHLKLKGFERQWQRHGGVDVLLFGNSVVQTIQVGHRPLEVAGRALALYNGGVGGLVPETARVLLDGGFYPIGTPGVLIYVLGARDLRDVDGRPREPGTHPFLQSAKARWHLADSPLDAAVAFLDTHLYLFGMRTQTRYYLTHGELPKTTEIKADENGVSPAFSSALKVDSFGADEPYRSRYSRFGIAPADGQIHHLERLITDARERGVRIVLVTSPIAPACFSLFDDPNADYKQYRDALGELAARTDTPLFDMHEDLGLPNVAFANADHVNRLGAAQIHAYLLQTIFPAVLDLPPSDHLDLFASYPPQVTSWYASVRKQSHSTRARKSAKPGPPGKPTEFVFRGVNLSGFRALRGAITAGTARRPASITFEVLIDDEVAFSDHLEATDTPVSRDFTVPVAARDCPHATLTLRTSSRVTQADPAAYWGRLILTPKPPGPQPGR